jgi:hypothetical protein
MSDICVGAYIPSQGNGWEVRVIDGYPNVRPIGDLAAHGASDCWCMPTLDGHIFIHHSADRREHRERAALTDRAEAG